MQSTGPLTAQITRQSKVTRSARVRQLEGIFDVQPSEQSQLMWDVSLPLHEREWSIGLMIGPSGCGKSTIARELFGAAYMKPFEWSADRSIIDDFPKGVGIKDITSMLSSVGFSSPPSWVRPFAVLSNGEQFRATLARALIASGDLCVFDEFTSVVDRTVAQIGSAAVAKTVRRSKKQFVAVTCHDDVEAWLDPDWVYNPSVNEFAWRSLRGRPPIKLDVCRVHSSAWRIFSKHHYLTAELNPAAVCFCAFFDGAPVAFHSYLPFFGRLKFGSRARRGHRSVCLPDYQGVGIGNALIDHLAGMWIALDYRVFRNTGHPAEITGAMRSPKWRLIRAPSMTAPDTNTDAKALKYRETRASNRLTASFEYIGPRMTREDADRQLNAWAIQ